MVTQRPVQQKKEMVMKKTTKALCAGLLALATWPWSAEAQNPGAAILTIEIANYVPYTYDIFDIQKFGTVPVLAPFPPNGGRAFGFFVFIGDIVAINGKPAKGLWTARSTVMGFDPNAAPGHSTADVTRGNVIDMYWEIMQPDGTPIGTLLASGLTRGSPPPGAPLAQTGDNLTIIGGTGAFLGARGQAGVIDLGSPRQASIVEDPASRRTIGGAKRSYVVHLLPLTTPEILIGQNGAAVVHASDGSPVTTAKPAQAGESLSLYASGLGPTFPGIDPGQPFTADPLQVVSSPVDVLVGGATATVLYAGGFPSAINKYQVNFRLPDGVQPGTASIQLSAAWIAGSQVEIAVR
jgi:uncharacterized protein (TIGR03437 family)